MNTIESSIVSKITAEIETATGDARSKLINDLWTVVAIAEKRAFLEAKGIVATMEEKAKAVVGAMEIEGEKLLGRVEAKP